MLVSQVAFFLPGPVWIFLEPWWSLREVEMHKYIGRNKRDALHGHPSWMCLGNKLSTFDADVTGGMKKSLSLVSLPLDKFNEIFREDIFTLNCLVGFLTASLLLHWVN